MGKNCSIIYNEHSGGYSKEALEAVKKVLLEYNYQINSSLPSQYPKHVTELVRENNDQNDLIIVLGGDGTIGEAFSGLHGVEQQAVLLPFSTGTASDLGASLGIDSKNPIDSLRSMLNNSPQTIDAFTINGRRFSYCVAWGAFTQIPWQTPADIKAQKGVDGYYQDGINKFFQNPMPILSDLFFPPTITYNLNGETINTKCIVGVASNSRKFAGVDIYKEDYVKHDDGLFEVALVTDINPLILFRVLSDYKNNNINLDNYNGFVKHFQTDYAKFEFVDHLPSFPLDIDGDKAPFSIEESKTIEIENQGKVKVLLPNSQGH